MIVTQGFDEYEYILLLLPYNYIRGSVTLSDLPIILPSSNATSLRTCLSCFQHSIVDMVTHWEEATTALQTDRHPDGRRLTVREREQYLKKYLPGVSTQRARYDELRSEKNSYEPMPARRYSRRMSLSEAMFDQLCLTLYTIIQLLLSLFVRIRILYHLATNVIHGMRYNHYRNPRYIKNDIRNLNKLPRHLSVTLQLDRTVSDGGTSILNEAAEIVAWTASAGISQLSIYEKTGELTNEASMDANR